MEIGKIAERKVVAASLALAMGAGALVACAGNNDPEAQAEGTASTAKEVFEVADEACPNTWGVVQLDNSNYQVISGGMPEIGAAQNDEEAREAANQWIDYIQRDPEMLAGNANVINAVAFDKETNYTASDLYDAETNCFNSTGEQAAAELRAAFEMSEITPDEAPADGTNTGVDAEGELVRSEHPGISGDLKAIKVLLPNGEEFHILGRCGNIVTKTPPPLPPGPTDEPKPEPSTTTTTGIAKIDDGRVPGPISEPGEVDVPGEGPAGQTPNEYGYIPTETPPSAPATTPTSHIQTSPTSERPTATTSPQPTSTNPPQTATTSVATTAPQQGTLPPRP